MLIENLVADAFATKCYILALGHGRDCVVVDPGFGVAERLGAALDSNGLRLRAVLLTHGHLDHTYSVTPVCAAHRVPVYLHPADNRMLSDPFCGLGPFAPQFEAIVGAG